jgi:hypothetical protein
MTETAAEQTQAAKAAPEKPFGPAAAALLAAGFGSLVLGIVTSLAEADEGAADALAFSDEVGPLSGKVIISTCAFFATWGILTLILRRRNPPVKPVLIAAGVMLALGVLGTFPTFFEIFAD